MSRVQPLCPCILMLTTSNEEEVEPSKHGECIGKADEMLDVTSVRCMGQFSRGGADDGVPNLVHNNDGFNNGLDHGLKVQLLIN